MIIRIIGKKRKVRVHGNGRVNYIYAWPTNKGLACMWTLGQLSGHPEQTLRARMGRYGELDQRVLLAEELPRSHQWGDKMWTERRKRRDPESIKLGTWELAQL